MLVGGDLGLRFLVAAFLVLIGPLLGFLVRRKWQHAVARREEIDRLLVLASEEAARAEFEAAAEYGFEYSGYSFGSVVGDEVPAAVPAPAPVSATLTSVPVARQLPYECAQCFSPASTRCSRCKAVRYCSGKCQIIHWRLGHKDECHPPVNNNHDSYGKGANDFKVFRQEANEGYAEGIETEERNIPGSIDASFAEPTCSEPSISGAENTEDVMEGKHLTDDGTTNSDSEFSPHSFSTSTASSESFSSTSISDDSDGFDKSVGAGSGHSKTFPTNSDHKPQFLEQSTVINSVNVVSSSKSGHVNPSADKNTKSKSSNSTVSSVNGSSESSVSVSSIPSSGFWEGTAHYSRSKVNVVDDVSHPDSEDVIAFNVSDSRLPTNRSSEMARTTGPSVDEQGPKAKPSDAAQLLQVKDNVDLKRPSLRPESHNTIDLNKASVRSTSSYKESRRSLSTASDACKVEHLANNDTLKVNTPPKASDKSIEGLKNVSQPPKARQVESLSTKAPDGHPSNNRRHDFQGAKSAKIDSAQVTACSSDSGGDSQSSKSGLKSSVSKVVDQLKASKSRHNSLGAWSEIGGRYNNKGLFPYELFVKLFNTKKVELRPFGLTNCGNSCYANAVLQCLAFTPPFTAYFLQGFHSKGCAKKDWCFNCEFESLVLKAKNGNSPLSPIRIISHLENIGSSLGNGREEDAHEFLRYVIETMQSVCLKEAGVRTSCSLEEQTSLIGLTFGGFLRSKIECMRCGGKSERHERIMDLTVEIDGDIASLEGALKQFTRTEILDGENKYHCSRCKSYEKARKKLKILEAPNVLTIALKRFQSGKFGKLNKTITFPEFLNLAFYMSGTSDKSPIYQLYGVIEHEDVMNAAFSGHYVCYVKNFQDKWFKVNDSKVKPVEVESVLSKGAYMLLYSRVSPRAPKLIRSLTSHDPRGQKNANCKSSSHTNSWDLSKGDPRNGPACRECFNSVPASSWPRNPTIFEDSSSDNSSSLFSEGGSSSTDSSYRDSISAEDIADQIFGDHGGTCWNSPWRISTDSDTSSSSSSPSPLYSRHSRFSNMGHYSSGYPETSGYADSAVEDQGFWTGTCDHEASKSKGSIPASFSPDSAKPCRHLGGSNSSSSGAQRLGSDKPFGTMKYR
nr:ubiquitin carboxyl-terminal hydrolase 17-like [Ipomoea batatas]